MFDLNDGTAKLEPASNDGADMIGMTPEDEPAEHELDSHANQRLHAKLMGYYRQELDRQEVNRAEMATDEDYYDNIQWTEEEQREMRERGQAPVVYNVISQSINWVIGSEKRGRSDFKVLPRRKGDGKAAERKTALLKYLGDVNWLGFERSKAFEDAVKAGIGWLECQIQDDDEGEPIYSSAESWRNIIHDSTYQRLDMSDCRYLFRVKWVDLDIALAMFPDRAEEIRRAATDSVADSNSDDYTNGDEAMDSLENERTDAIGGREGAGEGRSRVRLIEAWYRLPVQVDRLKGAYSDFRGEAFDPEDERHAAEVSEGRATIAKTSLMQMHVAIMTTSALLLQGVSPYRHNRYPFTPIWGMRRARDGLPYGLIRWMRSMQDDVNKRMSKALYILSSNKVIMDEGAVDDIEAFREEVARPDAVVIKKGGKEIKLDVDRDLAPAHLEMASRGMQMIQQVGGVTDELLGRTTNAVSGVAIQARQEQGSVGTNKFFDNLRLGFQQHGEKELSLVEQFMTQEKQFRITNARGAPDYIAVNDGLPENDITRTKADFVIDEAEWRATMRQAAVSELMGMAKSLPPEMVVGMLDLLVESMDLPNREELVKRIRQMNGQRDPDATELTPEEQQAEQANQAQMQMQAQMAQAQLDEAMAKARKANAEAERAESQAAESAAGAHLRSAQAVNEGVTAIKTATEAAMMTASVPELTPIADSMLAEAGWPGPQDPAQPPAQPMPPPEQLPPGMVPDGAAQPQPDLQGAM